MSNEGEKVLYLGECYAGYHMTCRHMQESEQKGGKIFMKYAVQYGDILNLDDDVDAIVNSANPFMSRGGGICGIIHKAAGFEFTEYCIKQGGLKVGECKLTPGFKLPYGHVIHVLSPVYGKVENPKQALLSTYHNVCELAEKNQFKRIAFPLLSGSHHRYPVELALEYAKEALETYNTDKLEAVLILKEM